MHPHYGRVFDFIPSAGILRALRFIGGCCCPQHPVFLYLPGVNTDGPSLLVKYMDVLDVVIISVYIIGPAETECCGVVRVVLDAVCLAGGAVVGLCHFHDAGIRLSVRVFYFIAVMVFLRG